MCAANGYSASIKWIQIWVITLEGDLRLNHWGWKILFCYLYINGITLKLHKIPKYPFSPWLLSSYQSPGLVGRVQVCHWHSSITVNPGTPQVQGLAAVVSPADVMALPWFWDISFSIVCFSWQEFLFQDLQHPSWISSLFLVLYFDSQKAVLLRRVSEEGFWMAEAWLSPH